MVTRSGWVLLVISVLTVAAGRAFGLAEFYVIGATGAFLVGLAILEVRRRPPDLTVDRLIKPTQVQLGGRSQVELRVTNRSILRSPVLTLLDPVTGTIGARVSLAPLAHGEEASATYRLPTERRGLLEVGPLEVHRTDSFGLAQWRQVVVGSAGLTVLPTVEALGALAGGSALQDPLGGSAQPVLGMAGDEDFATLRPYVVGDDLRRVHWASSARARDLLVRQHDPSWQSHVTVLLDARDDRLDAKTFELAVSAAASLVSAVAARGDRCRLAITDGTDTGLVDARAARDTMLAQLAVVSRHSPGPLRPPTTNGNRRAGGLVVITARPDATDLAHLAVSRSSFGVVHLVVFDSRADGAPMGPAVGIDAGVGLTFVDASTSFPLAWARSGPRSSNQR